MPHKPTRTDEIKVNNRSMTLIRSRRRTLSLEVGARGIRIRAPQLMSYRQIEDFVRSKESWLNKQLAALPEPCPKLSLTDGASVLFVGQPLNLLVSDGRGVVHHDGESITIPLQTSHLPPEETLRRKLIGWYKTMALTHVRTQVTELLPRMEPGSEIPEIRVREYRRRWGSCDSRGNLSFNWRLVQAPEAVLRYVVVHELAHRTEFNHSPEFWQIVERHDKDWRAHQRWLQQQGASLYRF
jgi:predicted metal-dependent hydrolase